MRHPYRALPDRAFWPRAVSRPQPQAVDPVGRWDLAILPETRVATAGSCFAQHIARHLQGAGFQHYVAEPGHPALPDKLRRKHGYGLFSARYGNIYTARQLRQLIARAYGRFSPQEGAWTGPDGSLLDPFRPSVQPGGFASVAELQADRAQHLAAVREMLEGLDVFIFTLGLTECWESRTDGAVFPLCPGVEGGSFDAANYAFRNQGVDEVLGDMQAFLAALWQVNPGAEVILTVSPVPLMATAAPGAHVLAATTYSKSVLRVAAEMLTTRFARVHYFPSYEIITGSYSRGAYFAEDLRNVTEAGVAHVMRVFLRHAAQGGDAPTGARLDPNPPENDPALQAARSFTEVECDEAALDGGKGARALKALSQGRPLPWARSFLRAFKAW